MPWDHATSIIEMVFEGLFVFVCISYERQSTDNIFEKLILKNVICKVLLHGQSDTMLHNPTVTLLHSQSVAARQIQN